MKRAMKQLAAGLAVTALAAGSASAQTQNWFQSTTSSNWGTASNWNQSRVPSTTDQVILSATTAQPTVYLNGTRWIHSMIFSGTSMERHLATGTPSDGVLALTGATGGMIRNDMSAMAYVDCQVHSYAGATTLKSDGSGGLTFTNLVFMGNGDPGTNLTLDGANNGFLNNVQIVAGKSLIKNGNGTWTISGQGLLDGNGNTVINAGTLKIGGGGTLGSSGSYAQTISIGTNSAFQYSSSANQALGGNIGGSGQIIKDTSAASTLTLSGTNTYTGATNINAGTLQLDGSTHANSTVAIGTAGTLTGGGTVNGNATLTGSGVINKSAGTIAGTLGVTGGNWNGSGAVTGAVTSSSGTFTIGSAGNLTATSGVSATGGNLVVNGTLTGSLNVNSSTTISGTGTIIGNTTISGTHSPGNSPGIQTYGSNLTYEAGSNVLWELVANSTVGRGTNFDGIDVGAILDFNGATTLDLNFQFGSSLVEWQNAFWASDYTGAGGWLVYSGATSIDGFANLGLNSPAAWLDESGDSLFSIRPDASFSLFQDGNNIYLNYAAVPEPSAAALGGLGILALLRRRRH